MMEENGKNIIRELSLEFSKKLLKVISRKPFINSALNANQLIRSGTAVGAMVRETQGAESRKDFIHKLKLAFKEAEESEYWLILFNETMNNPELEELKNQIIQIKKILSKIISTSILNDKSKL